MQKLNDLFQFFNRRKFLIEICGLNPDGGLNFRLIGKGTNKFDKKTEPTTEEKAAIKAGLEVMKTKIDDVIQTLN